MRNYKISIDLADLYIQIKELDLKDYNQPFMLKFIEAENPDDACYVVLHRIIQEILETETSIKSRILCRKIRRFLRIERIEAL